LNVGPGGSRAIEDHQAAASFRHVRGRKPGDRPEPDCGLIRYGSAGD
jgi:hypothetical protein